MKHALLMAIHETDADHEVDTDPNLVGIESILRDLGTWSVTRIECAGVDRAMVQNALDDLERRVEPGDDCLFYFFGHGGVARFFGLDGPLGERLVFYLELARSDPNEDIAGFLDCELSASLARIDRICGNVTAIIDCCHSGRMVRSGSIEEYRAPPWAKGISSEEADCSTVVRLTGASSMRTCYTERVEGGRLGRMTGAFIELIRDVGTQAHRLTWDTIAHCVRERVIARMGCEEQWVSFAGPRERLLFSRRRVPLPPTAAFIPSEDGHGGWLRVGLLHGVDIGDEWAVTEPAVDEDSKPRVVACVRVTQVDLNRATVTWLGHTERSSSFHHTAFSIRSRSMTPIDIGQSPTLRAAVGHSCLIRPSLPEEGPPLARVRHQGECWLVESEGLGTTANFDDHTQVVDHLEQLARSKMLLELPSKCDQPNIEGRRLLRVSCVHYGRRTERLELIHAAPDDHVQFHVGDRIELEIGLDPTEAMRWYVCAIEIDISGRPLLLNQSEPDGLELLPHEVVTIGGSLAGGPLGRALVWPAHSPIDHPRSAQILLLASDRPIPLGPLLRTEWGPDLGPLRQLGRARRTVVRHHLPTARPRRGPEPCTAWHCQLFGYTLHPAPRQEPPDQAGRCAAVSPDQLDSLQ